MSTLIDEALDVNGMPPAQFHDPGTSYPATGEVDLMKYAENNRLPSTFQDFWDRSIAAEEDVKSLLWLARMRFK